MTFASTSIRGDFHVTNEDFLLRQPHRSAGNRHLCFLADGQGGRPDGDVASRAACEGGIEAAQAFSWEQLGSPSSWHDIFFAADSRVRECCEGFTTLVGFAIDGETVLGASVGDSAVHYLDQASGVFAELTEDQVKNPPVGSGHPVVTPFLLPVFRGRLLALTDGVWKYTDRDILKEAARRPAEEVADFLIGVVRERYANQLPDDFSLIACAGLD